MLYIGVDLGTSSVKLLLMDESGDIKSIVTREYPLYFPQPGWSEQNPEDWFSALTDGIKELTKDCDKTTVDGISFSGQMHGMVILDEEDKVIRPAILWNDGRTQAECDYLNNEIGRDKISAYTGNMALTGFTAPKLLWVKKHEPENFAKIKKVMLPKDYAAYCLSGVHCTDVSDASGMLLLDVKNKCWSKEMLDIIGLKEEQLAKVYESYEVVGTLKKDIAKELGLPESVKVIAGGGDQAVAAVGTGTVGEGMCNVSLGTSGVVFIASKEYAEVDQNALHVFAHADGKYHFMGVMLSAAASNKWWQDEIIGTKEYKKEEAAITKLGDNNVYFLPYLMGERTPHNNPNARGTFIGMTMDTTRADMTQAMLEGVAFALRDSFEITKKLGVNIDRIRINGGGAKSPLWCKIIADVLNVKVDKINSAEGPAFGAAILAAVGCGKYASVEEAAGKLIKVIETTEQDPVIVAKYNKKYDIFKDLYPTLKTMFDRIAE
ncbi:xylulokinase [Anaerocolumna sp. AGMB13025]|uniref:xylulokinase n=1 Tax=Anaerocolumna sp. AGMB13025 TaxID=3039116 RepID=UPI00241EC9ED|nr:xylulokinase [Anaerocolumna sp. AGMB13025]WFR58268.1 xylulokinase [Anaerocolumna sp. AGMB13025]